MPLNFNLIPPYAADVHTLEDNSRVVTLKDASGVFSVTLHLNETGALQLADALRGAGLTIAKGSDLQLAKR